MNFELVMEESEKMATLKKVYADIILNTAKEAAARIMVSEKKALRFQQEIFSVKDEALSMLVRLKKMMDSKTAEAEIAALSQRKRVEELEAQLHQAESIVRDLRTELNGLQDELKKVKNNQMQPLDERIMRESSDFNQDALQDTRLAISESIALPMTSNSNTALLNQRHRNAHCCLVRKYSIKQIERRSESSENCYAGNSDLASIIMRSKEPELYRNGCTQRVRAFERNFLKKPVIRENGTAEGTCLVAHPKDDNMGSTEKNPTKLDNSSKQESDSVKELAVQLPTFFTRKRRTKHRRTSSYNEQDTKAHEPSNLCRCNTYPGLVNSMAESGEDVSRISGGAERNLESHLIPVSSLHLTNVNLGSEQKGGIGSHGEVTQSEILQTAVEDTVIIDESALTKQDTRVAESSEVQLCEPKKDDIRCEMTNGTPTKTVNDKFLKYTFQRKRKRESLSIPGDNALLEKKNMSKTISEEKQSSSPEPKASTLIVESSRENRRLMQVARQLISLSEKKWWQ